MLSLLRRSKRVTENFKERKREVAGSMGCHHASHASSSSPQTELIMCKVQASAPTRSRVRHVKIVAMSLRSPVREMGSFL